MRTYLITKGKTVKSANDYGQAVVDAHALGEGANVFSVGIHNGRVFQTRIKIVRFPYPTKG
jgi:hypothetical protein